MVYQLIRELRWKSTVRINLRRESLLLYCMRSVILRRMTDFAPAERLYFSKTAIGSRRSVFRNSGSLAARRSMSLIISASFCWWANLVLHSTLTCYLFIMHVLCIEADSTMTGILAIGKSNVDSL